MARYIKANPLVAKFLKLENDRNAVTDGNYLLWQGDMLAFGPLTRLSETLTAIGAIALMPHEAREEQDGTVIRPLPEATDPRFIIAPAVVDEPTEVPGTDAEGENAPDDSDTEAQSDDAGPEEETTNEPETTNTRTSKK